MSLTRFAKQDHIVFLSSMNWFRRAAVERERRRESRACICRIFLAPTHLTIVTWPGLSRCKLLPSRWCGDRARQVHHARAFPSALEKTQLAVHWSSHLRLHSHSGGKGSTGPCRQPMSSAILLCPEGLQQPSLSMLTESEKSMSFTNTHDHTVFPSMRVLEKMNANIMPSSL